MDEGEVARLREHTARMMAGELDEVELIRAGSLEAALRAPLVDVIRALEAQGRALALGRTPRLVLIALDEQREAAGMSKSALAERAGLSRGHLLDLLRSHDPRPTLATILRLTIALGDPLAVVELTGPSLDPPTPSPQELTPPGGPWPWTALVIGVAGAGTLIGLWLMKRKSTTDATKRGPA